MQSLSIGVGEAHETQISMVWPTFRFGWECPNTSPEQINFYTDIYNTMDCAKSYGEGHNEPGGVSGVFDGL